uniref:Uncharacterized protein n=1 Tax=Setaria digitata TaxID=48799 RepID=A0A915PLL1_9BILA
MPSTPSSSTFYRNLWRLTDRNRKRKKESLTNSHSNSDEAVNEQRFVEASLEAHDALPSKGLFYSILFFDGN